MLPAGHLLQCSKGYCNISWLCVYFAVFHGHFICKSTEFSVKACDANSPSHHWLVYA